MANAFGKELKKICIDKNIPTKALAEKIGISASYLSVIVTSNRPIPRNLIRKLRDSGELTDAQINILKKSAEKLKPKISIKFNGVEDEERNFCLAFTERVDDLDEKDKKLIKSILEKY